MISIRKFVGYTGAAAGMGAALALGMSTQAGLAAAPRAAAPSQVTASQSSVTVACAAAIQAIKTAVVNDLAEDRSERAVAKTNPDVTTDPTEDAAERANFKALFSAALTACGATEEQNEPRFTPSTQCTAVVQALKAAWAQGRPTTLAQWQHLQALAQAVRTACGWTWTERS